MVQGGHKLFADKQKLYIVTNLRINGWAIDSLCIFVGCDRSSLVKQFQKYGIEPQGEVYAVERLAAQVISQFMPPEPTYKLVNGVRYNIGKSYAEYLAERR